MYGSDPVKLAAGWMVTIGIGMATLGGGVTFLAVDLMQTTPTIWQVDYTLVGATTAERIFLFGLLGLVLGIGATLLGAFLWLRTDWLIENPR